VSQLPAQKKTSVLDRLRLYIDSMIEVHLIDEKIIKGRLAQVDDDLVNIFLENCVDGNGRASPAAVIMGTSISHINIISLPVEETLDERVFQLILKNGDMPVKEISKILDIKPKVVNSAIKRLKKSGLLAVHMERAPAKKRMVSNQQVAEKKARR
jgi:small nuclear ribonucleoprotein (snRNP)-like protein